MKLKFINNKIRGAVETAARCCAAATATDSLEIARVRRAHLSGIDHLRFVIGLLFLVGFRQRLIAITTAFTFARSRSARPT